MKNNTEQYWQAYLDGELSASEAADFEASLTDAQREQLAVDMRVERVIAEHLARDAECPDGVWERTKARIARLNEMNAPRVSSRRRWYWRAATLAAVAALAFVISVVAPTGGSPETSSVIFAASSVEELVATSEAEPGSDAAERYIRDKGVGLQLEEDSFLETMRGRHYDVHIIGARQELHNGEPVTEILIECCGRPIKVLLARLDSKAASEIGLAAARAQEGNVQATRVVGGYLVAVVSRHQTHGLLDLISE